MQPRLVITERIDGVPTMGTCNACLQLTFTSSGEVGPPSDSLEQLEQQFDEHYRQEHMGPGSGTQ